MNSSNFYRQQRQSKIGVLLVFGSSLYHLVKNLWFLGIYFFMNELGPRMVTYSAIVAAIVLVFAFGYSILYYWRFTFFIDLKTEEFVLKKGVFNSETISIPFNKIQQVNFRRNLVQRLVGVYSILIDTAGSKEKEVEIRALSRVKAEQLAELLMNITKRKGRVEPETKNEKEERAPIDWHYSLNVLQLLKLGLSSNYLRGLLLLITFYLTLRDQFFLREFLPAEIVVEGNLAYNLSAWMVLLLMLAVVVVTVGDTFIKYYNLHLKKSDSGLQVEMGLRKNKKVSLKAKRVQSINISSNPIQQRLDLHKVKIYLASSANDPDKSVITIPGVSQEFILKILDYVYGISIEQVSQIIPDKILIFKKVSRGLFPLLLIPFIIGFYDLDLPIKTVSIGIVIYIIILIAYQFLYFRSLRLTLSEEVIVKHSGVWRSKRQYVEIWKLQSVSILQPFWYRKKDLVNLILYSAGGDIFFELIDRNEAESLIDYLLYKSESTSRGWM